MHRRHRLGDRPQLRRLRPAGQRRHHASCTRARPTTRSRTASGTSSSSTGSTSSTPRRPPSAPSCSWGEQWPRKHDLSSLRLLGTVGEPINPEAWMWYHAVIGGERCPIVDTWWQTETGAIMITPLPGAVPTKPGSGTLPVLRRRRATSWTRTASPCPPGAGGLPGDQQALALDAAHRLRRPRALRRAVLERSSPASTSPATAPGATRTATSGSWAASTTCSTSPATASARWRSRARSCRHAQGGRGGGRRARPTSSRARPSSPSSRSKQAALNAGRRAAGGAARSTSSRRSAPSRGPTRSASPTPCPRRAAARSCGACCATSRRQGDDGRHDDPRGLLRAGQAARGRGVIADT